MTVEANNVRYDWYQNSSHVIVNVFIKNLKQDQFQAFFKDNEVQISFKNELNTSITLSPLFSKIESSSCKCEVYSSKIELKLKKQTEYVSWTTLLSTEVDEQSRCKKPSYPTSSKTQRDWDKIEKSVIKEESEKQSELDDFFKKIYKDASDEQKKAMIKSFTESEGTCLSTNWAEIGKKKTPISPPDAMETRKD